MMKVQEGYEAEADAVEEMPQAEACCVGEGLEKTHVAAMRRVGR
jgi:hypothetical protein